jgi:hypothetical protein
MPTPKNYRDWPVGEKLDKTMKAWRVQTKKFPQIDPGLVSDPYGFGDSPDAEAISSGLNGKGPHSVALGRHGNFFLWGFSAQPSDMTPEARLCFVNVIHYIKKFDRQKPLVHWAAKSREWALVFAWSLKEDHGKELRTLYFPPEVCKRFGDDADKYVAYCTENLEYVRLEGFRVVVDEDVKQMGLSNRKVELLDRCVALLEKGEQRDLALRVLKRYTTETYTEAKKWRSWLDKNRDRLFFTDFGGYKFMVGPVRVAPLAK